MKKRKAYLLVRSDNKNYWETCNIKDIDKIKMPWHIGALIPKNKKGTKRPDNWPNKKL